MTRALPMFVLGLWVGGPPSAGAQLPSDPPAPSVAVDPGPAVEPADPRAIGPDVYAQAEAAFAAGRYREAQADFARAVQQRPDAPQLRYQLAVAAAAAGDPALAEREATAVAQLDPGNPAAVSLAVSQRLARLRRAPPGPAPSLDEVERALADGRIRAAARLAAQALDHAPEPALRARLLTARGRALLAAQEGEAAAVALRSAAGLGIDGPQIWLALARAYAAEGRTPAARICYEVAAAIAPGGGPIALAAEAEEARLGRAERGSP